MQPREERFWQPESVSQADSTPPEADQPQPFPSAYSGYGLSEVPSDVDDHPKVIDEVQWDASEYVQHDKDASWFIILTGITALLLGAAVFLRQWTFAALIIAMAVAIVVYARRPPRTLHYRLSHEDFSIEDKDYSYNDFKAFSLSQDGPLHTVTLLPRKRFSPPVSMYFAEEDGEQIVDILATHMPLEPIKHDIFDDFVRKLRF